LAGRGYTPVRGLGLEGSLLIVTPHIFQNKKSLPAATCKIGAERGIVRFYNGRGTAEQWIKEGIVLDALPYSASHGDNVCSGVKNDCPTVW